MLEYLVVMLVFTMPSIIHALYMRRFKMMIVAALIGLVFGLPWDIVSGVVLHTWYWDQNQVLGVWVLGLPVEELMFMVLVPIALVNLTYQLQLYLGKTVAG